MLSRAFLQNYHFSHRHPLTIAIARLLSTADWDVVNVGWNITRTKLRSLAERDFVGLLLRLKGRLEAGAVRKICARILVQVTSCAFCTISGEEQNSSLRVCG